MRHVTRRMSSIGSGSFYGNPVSEFVNNEENFKGKAIAASKDMKLNMQVIERNTESDESITSQQLNDVTSPMVKGTLIDIEDDKSQ